MCKWNLTKDLSTECKASPCRPQLCRWLFAAWALETIEQQICMTSTMPAVSTVSTFTAPPPDDISLKHFQRS